MTATDFNGKTLAFLQWFKSLPGATFSDQIEIVDLRERNAGRGIVAVQDIPADSLLFTIPRNRIISIETSQLKAKLPNVFVTEQDSGSTMELDGDSQQDPWSTLILVMLYEHFQSENSSWKPYLDVLPTSFNTPMFWSDEELQELQSSSMRAKIGKGHAENMFHAKILPVIRQHQDVFPSCQTRSDDELIQLAHQMGSTIMSYAFDFEDEGDEREEDHTEEWVEDTEARSTTMGLVSMADILNADAEFNARVNYGDDSLTVTSVRAIKAGEEILNYYGPLANSELLRRYGYVSQKHSRYDVVEIPWALVEEAIVAHLGISATQLEKAVRHPASVALAVQLTLLKRDYVNSDELETVFVLERDSDEPSPNGTFTGPARFIELPEDLQDQLKSFLKAIRKVGANSLPDKRKRDEVQHAVMAKVLGALESKYSTTATEDERLLQGSELDERTRMAITVRLGEKQLLQEAKAYLSRMASDTALDEGPGPDKKAKRST